MDRLVIGQLMDPYKLRHTTMFKSKMLIYAVVLGLAFLPLRGIAEWEISGYLKNETAILMQEGVLTGHAQFTGDTAIHHAGDIYKSESTLKLFVNKTLSDNAVAHAEVNFIYDTAAIDGYKGHDSDTQHDYLRELYVDTSIGDTDLRIGKQQVVWGTADGMKLLDIINPTDWREFNQNKMEDSRIPVWMLNANTLIDDSSDVQFIMAQAKEHHIPGLNADGDAGHPFIMLGVDTITGSVNGFLNIFPRLAHVASSFSLGANNNLFGASDNNGDTISDGLVRLSGLSVNTFASLPWALNAEQQLVPRSTFLPQGSSDNVQNFPNFSGSGFVLLNAIAQQGLPTLMQTPGDDPYGNHNATNLMNQTGGRWSMAVPADNSVSWDIRNPKSTFEYMPNAAFATFNNAAGNLWLANRMLTPQAQGGLGMNSADLGYASDEDFYAQFHSPGQSQYVRDYPNDPVNLGVRFKKALNNGLNFSLNYFYSYDSNPSVNISYRDSVTGEVLSSELRRPIFAGHALNYSDDFTHVIRKDQVKNHFDGTIATYHNLQGQYYGAFNPITNGLAALGDTSHSPHGITMTLTETLERNHNLGAAFDYVLDTETLGAIVLRGEFLYKKDEMHPIIDRHLLAIGYLPEALTSEGHDMFKYVLGADFTVLTNMLMSLQFIQFRHLDFQEEQRTCWTGFTEGSGVAFDCSRYTADISTLHLSNGLQKAEKNKEFISLFFSKPFGEEQQGRWNNITIAEDMGGFWNRFDIEYAFNDNLIGTLEWNAYWGDKHSMFGQFNKADNFQLGVKYLF